MKNLIVCLSVLLFANLTYADFTSTINVNSNDLQQSKIDSFDVFGLKDYTFMTIAGAPQLPEKFIRVILPNDKRVLQNVLSLLV